jgi:enamine deaminase RidA (YjgF/YER057c/UK114 family)
VTFSIVNPASLGEPKGWNHGLLAESGGRVLFVAGMTASDASGRVAAAEFVTQFDRALAHVVTVVREAGGEPSDIGRLTIFVTDMNAYRASLKRLGGAYRAHMGRHFPAVALVAVSELVDENAVVEIEATAVLSKTR